MADPNRYYEIIRRPLMTEKSTVMQDLRNQYTFRVHPDATKPEIRKAVQALFKVEVEAVNVMRTPGKLRRILGRPGRAPGWKKAIVTLAQGQTIDFA